MNGELRLAASVHMSNKEARTPERRDLERRASRFHPDPQLEAQLAQRAKDPAAWDAANRGTAGLPLAIYADARAAASTLGQVPAKETE